jgi:hypothetical protein
MLKNNRSWELAGGIGMFISLLLSGISLFALDHSVAYSIILFCCAILSTIITFIVMYILKKKGGR